MELVKMILRIGLIICLGLFVRSVSADDDCDTDNWSEWEQCLKEDDLEGSCHDVMGVSKEIDEGRRMMALLMTEKEREFSKPCHEEAIHMDGQRVPCENGMADIYPCKNIDLLSHLTINDLDPSGLSHRVNDMWGWIDIDGEAGGKSSEEDSSESESSSESYESDSFDESNGNGNSNESNNDFIDEYAMVGTNDGTIFIRVTNPLLPEVLGKLPPARAGNRRVYWRDIKVIGHYAFIGSEIIDHGMQIFDLRQLRGLSANNTRQFEMSALYDGVGGSHNIVANVESNTIFIVGSTDPPSTEPTSGGSVCDGGLHMVDVSDPLNPKFISCFGDDGYVHDAQCVTYDGPDERYHDHEICFCYSEDTLTIADVTDKHNVQIISRTEYQGVNYTHQGWATEDFRIILLDDELDEYEEEDQRTKTYVWNIEDLEAPDMKNIHVHSTTAIDHNQYTNDGYTYQSNYMAGLRVLRINQKNYKLKEVAYFDTYPADTTAQFDGTWSNYPYFRSGAVGVSDISNGFFLLDVHIDGDPQFEADDYLGLRRRRRARKNKDAFCKALDLEQFVECED